jgi:hypothetical protein
MSGIGADARINGEALDQARVHGGAQYRLNHMKEEVAMAERPCRLTGNVE